MPTDVVATKIPGERLDLPERRKRPSGPKGAHRGSAEQIRYRTDARKRKPGYRRRNGARGKGITRARGVDRGYGQTRDLTPITAPGHHGALDAALQRHRRRSQTVQLGARRPRLTLPHQLHGLRYADAQQVGPGQCVPEDRRAMPGGIYRDVERNGHARGPRNLDRTLRGSRLWFVHQRIAGNMQQRARGDGLFRQIRCTVLDAGTTMSEHGAFTVWGHGDDVEERRLLRQLHDMGQVDPFGP